MEDRDYFVLVNADDGKRGVPIYLDGKIHEKFTEGGADVPMSYQWNRPIATIPERGSPLSFPDELWLHVKHRRISFDIRVDFRALLMSERFLELLPDDDRANFKIARLHVVNRRGKNVADHPMYFARFTKVLFLVDVEHSEFRQSTLLDGTPIFDRNGKPVIDELYQVSLDREALGREGAGPMNLLEASDMPVSMRTLASRSLCEQMVEHRIVGVGLCPTNEIGRLEEYLSDFNGRVSGQRSSPFTMKV